MGTKVHCESYLPVYHSMRDLNEDSSSSSWPLCYGDKPVANGQYYNGYAPRTTADLSPGNNKDVLKQRMLEHEAVFKDQVYELHRLYRRQQDMMQEVRRTEVNGLRESMEPSSSSSHRGPVAQVPTEDARKWHMAGFPLSNSPMSCTKPNSQQPYQNGSMSKDTEALGSTRPLKVRKKLFDLQLPADECVDLEEGETLPEVKLSSGLSYSSNANLRIDPESRRRLNIDNHAGLEPDCRIVTSSSASRLGNTTGLADLNEPIVIEEVTAPLPPGFLGHCSNNGETKSIHQPEKVNAGYIGVSGETTQARNGYLVDSIESKVNESRRLSGIYQAGSSRSNLHSMNHCLQQGKSLSSHLMHGMSNPANCPLGNYPSGRCREDPWRAGNPQSTDRNRGSSTNGHLGLPVAFQANGSYPIFGSWPQPASSWSKANMSSTQKISPLESSSSPSQLPFAGNWRVSGSNTMLYRQLGGGESTAPNGLHHGCASGSKDQKTHLSSSFDGPKLKNKNAAPDHVATNGYGSFKGSCQVDSKPVLDFNLNEAFSMGSENEVDPSARNVKGKLEGNLSTIPWLKRKPSDDTDSSANARKSEILGESRYCPASEQFCSKIEIIRDLNQPFVPSDGEGLIKKEIVEAQNVTKILGIPVFETGKPSTNVFTSTSVDFPGETSNGNKERKRRMIDINLECMPDEEEPCAEEEIGVKVVREFIDLNSCASDCEDPSVPSDQSQAASFKTPLEIDLEAPAAPDEDDDNNTPLEQDSACEVASLQSITEEPNDEVATNAAKMMVSMLSFSPQQLEHSLAESLDWLADVLTNDMEGTLNNELIVTDGAQAETDEFEAMTLRIRETKEGDYMPDPFIPETLNFEDPGANALTTRPRRGQSRRGRPRRDFQRDILPGVATLSRHEVTEDIQLFTGMMRATGCDWTSALTRRNGAKTRGARGRRRAVVVAENVPSPAPCTPLVQTVNNVEAAVGLDDRSLTGWGKTTRRPRRQRCHTAGNGNPQAIVLT